MTATERHQPTGDDDDLHEWVEGHGPISINEIAELRATIPYLIGFYPERSLVAIGLADDSTVVVTARVDAPIDLVSARSAIAHLAPVLERATPSKIIIAYCDDYEISSSQEHDREQIIDAARRACETVVDLSAVLAQELEALDIPYTFIWPENPGMPRSRNGVVPQIAVAHALAGRSLLRTRADLASTVDPVGGEPRRRVQQHLDALAEIPMSRIDLVALVTDMLDRCASPNDGRGAAIVQPHEVAICVRALADVGSRDMLITVIAQERSWWLVDPWQRVVQLVPDAHVAPAATMLAIVSYLGGNGALAGIALDAALRRDPDYSLAQMIDVGLRAGLHPNDLQEVLASTFDELIPAAERASDLAGYDSGSSTSR